jgi:4-alpha-glucanotransferase
MHPLVLSLAIHNHQPVGNFDHIVAEATDQAYEPLVAALERHPRIRLALHYSGPLLDWLRAHRPEFLGRVRSLATRGQVELMTGGYYEPILAIVPDDDKRGQIEKLTRTINEWFGYSAEGLWLAERVWEPHLARPLGEAGVQYTIVDDTHFHAAGITDDQLLGYYLTEESGIPLAVFPSLKRLRYLIPWVTVEEVIAYLHGCAQTETRTPDREAPLDLALMGDDGEKFGAWPGTHEHCWTRGWMDRFFDALESTSWIEIMPPGEYRRTREAAGRVYLPTSTYEEMSEWALPTDQAARLLSVKHGLPAQQWDEIMPFVRGGFWRHFLVKYAEVNTMHRLALRAGRKVRALPAGAARTRALDSLWAGQGNCPYWHGVFGGVYLPHIRGAAFSNLIAAEAAADAVEHPGSYARGETADLDGDGRPDVRLATDMFVLTVDPWRGGRVVEWDYRPRPRHVGNVLTRRPEAYHAELLRPAAGPDGDALESIHTTTLRVKEPGLERFLVYDRERRVSQRFHLMPERTTLEQVWRDEQEDLGGFAAGPYQWTLSHAPAGVTLRLTRESPLGGGRAAVERQLELAAGRHDLQHRLRLRWQGDEPLRALAALEWGLGVFGGPEDLWVDAGGRRLSLHELGELPTVDRVTVTEAHSGLMLAFTLSIAAEVWSFPLITVSNSEGGYERTDQGAVLILRWPVTLEPGQVWEETTRAEIAGTWVKTP